jgi:uncharacterized cupredoxin-like copper-binding protein
VVKDLVEAFRRGMASWVMLHLAPRNYELLCDVPGHYASGMFAGFTVG